MQPTLEQRANICFGHGIEAKEGLQREQAVIREAYFYRSPYGSDPLGLVFRIDCESGFDRIMKCTEIKAIEGLMADLGANTSEDLVGKDIIAYLRNREGREAELTALSKYQYDEL